MLPSTAAPYARLLHRAGGAFLVCWLLLSSVSGLRAAELPPFEHAETTALVTLVSDAARLVADQGVAGACLTFKDPNSRFLVDDTYIFVFDTAGNALCHPARPSFEGQSLVEIRDPDGRMIVRQFLSEVASPEPNAARQGWVHYLWPKPKTTTLLWKSTFLINTSAPDGQAVIVGGGAYTLPPERAFAVEQVDDAARLIARKGTGAYADLRDKASGFRFLDTYVFVLSEDGTMLVNPGFPELEGQAQIDLSDHRGKKMIREMVAVAKANGNGWVDYHWPRPGDSAPSAKSAYVLRADVEGKMVVIGSALYVGTPERPIATINPPSPPPAN